MVSKLTLNLKVKVLCILPIRKDEKCEDENNWNGKNGTKKFQRIKREFFKM